MFRKIVHATLALLAHVAVLFAAHGLAERVGHEVLALIRDEWVVNVADAFAP